MRVQEIPLLCIAPNPDQPRRTFDPAALDELAASIKQSGLLQPITVRKHAHGQASYQIVAGERRWRACAIAGVHLVPCIVRRLGDREAFIIAVMENVARADMNPIEEAVALRRLLDLPMTPQEIEVRIGMAANIVTWKASLTRCIDTVAHLVARGQFPVAQAISLSRLSPVGQQTALREYQSKRMTQLEFTQVVNAIHARENNLTMFDETIVSKAATAAAFKFRNALDTLTSAAAALDALDVDELAPALPDMGANVGRIEEATKILQRSRSKLLRAKGRQHARLMDVAP